MQLRRAAFLVLSSTLAATSVSATTGTSDIGWGKAGVPLQAYSADAAGRVHEAVGLDIRLTEDQQSRLRQLAEGSAERQAYLHSLAEDPSVLRRHGPGTPPLPPPQG